MRGKIKRVLLIRPPITFLNSSYRRCVIPIGLAYIAAVLEGKGIEVSILDAYAEGYHNIIRSHEDLFIYGLEDREIEARLIDYAPDLVGVSCTFSSEIKSVLHTCREVKKTLGDIPTVVGGLHPSFYPESVLKESSVDFVVMGEGEYRMLKLIQALNACKGLNCIDGLAYKSSEGVLVIQPMDGNIENLDVLPLPARHLLKMDIYLDINVAVNPYPRGNRTDVILTSRGCPYKCTFCASYKFWGRHYRVRSPENVAEEIDQMVKEYRVDEIQFLDDSPTSKKDRAYEIMNRFMYHRLHWCPANGVIINSIDEEMLEHMAESGCYQVVFPVESGNPYVLKNLIKKPVKLDLVKPLRDKCKELGMSTHAHFILGFPGETREQMKETFAFARRIRFDSISFFAATPLPGSELFDLSLREGLLPKDYNFDKMDFHAAKLHLPEISSKDLEFWINRETLIYNFNYFLHSPLKYLKKYCQYYFTNPREIPILLGEVWVLFVKPFIMSFKDKKFFSFRKSK